MRSKTMSLLLLLNFVVWASTLANSDNCIYGIDISHHQGEINWTKVSQWNGKKIDFVYMKATEGATLVDRKYKENLEEARNKNFLVGSYHYFKTTSHPLDQFNNFITTAPREKQQLIPIVDVEERGKQWNDKTFHKNLKSFLSLVEEHYGCKPIIYTSNTFYNTYLANKYSEYKIFIGRYSTKQPNLKDAKDWHIWQFSKTGLVNGISKHVDINRIHSERELKDIMID